MFYRIFSLSKIVLLVLDHRLVYSMFWTPVLISGKYSVRLIIIIVKLPYNFHLTTFSVQRNIFEKQTK